MIFLVVKGLLLSRLVLVFHESTEGESSSQGEARNSNEKFEMLNKEIKGQPHQQPRKESLQRKSFTPNYGSDNWFFPLMNNFEFLYVIILDMLQLDVEVKWFKLITIT